ncbi:unnamed protein product [Coregonus sp. 'balchen']|nr:unnamed protein product [Coregonus sp. 'balchen']
MTIIARLPTPLQPLFRLLYLVIFGLAVVGNIAVLVLLCKRKALQSPSTFFICTLALTTNILTMTCITVERFQGILHPLHVCNGYFLCHACKMLGEGRKSDNNMDWFQWQIGLSEGMKDELSFRELPE